MKTLDKHDETPVDMKDLCRKELAEALGYDLNTYLGVPVWGQLLKEVKRLTKDRRDLNTLISILEERRQ